MAIGGSHKEMTSGTTLHSYTLVHSDHASSQDSHLLPCISHTLSILHSTTRKHRIDTRDRVASHAESTSTPEAIPGTPERRSHTHTRSYKLTGTQEGQRSQSTAVVNSGSIRIQRVLRPLILSHPSSSSPSPLSLSRSTPSHFELPTFPFTSLAPPLPFS